jgi:HEAT repeat protein
MSLLFRMTDFKPQTWNGVPIPYGASVADLRAMIDEPGPKAWAAIRALGEKPEADALSALVQLTRSSDPHLRRSAVEAIGIHPSGQTASKVVCELLHDRDNFIVRAAVKAAANLRLDSARERVLSLVKASEESTRIAALRALESLWQSSDFETVFDLYRHDRSDEVRKQAAWSLQKNVGADHWERLFSAWSKDSVPRHRVWACEFAGRFGSRAVLPALEALRADHDGHVRAAARQAAERIGAG